ncbi:DUF4369 domain-containing protein [Candidatus Symbiothrix dinenymphae]|uniref:DUF4369 domain-containing protein n=1 Tax=Candidatus Symbiothrix dinenymphae TaxID=467085 RepID=UPI0006E29B73|nr:DUF4369 domain-containing protein [Candidatus Symbiothrix dinenymphae]
MKTKYIHIILLCIGLLACNKEPQQFVIEGDVKGTTSPVVCFVTWHDSNPQVDTATIKGGKFMFSASSKNIQSVVIYFEKGSNWVTAWAKNGDKITLQGDVNDPEQILICGNATNELLTDFKQNHKDTPIETLLVDAEEFVKANPASIASLVVIQDYMKDNIPPNLLDEYLRLIQSPARENWLYARLVTR